ncbi:hypothetical protein pb186bvf_019127 [Paramecium bursaria]
MRTNLKLNTEQIELKFKEERPIQVVRFISQNNKFEINPEAKDFISNLQGNIGFVVVCGRYRTGKSYLLNKLLEAQGDGFKVDAATDSCTQGIWMYTKPLQTQNIQIYFLDTEGSESVERSQTHDSKIFALAILMSSIFIFNSQGCIDEQSISQLQLTTTLAKSIQVQEAHQNDQVGNEGLLGYFTPKFIWILRDFVLELEDKNKRKISPKEYLENALHDDSAYVRTNENNKKIRKSLLQFFKDRDCFTMIRPISDEDQLRQLNKLPIQQLRKEFQQQLIQLRETIIKSCQPKQLNGVNLNGRMFCEMIENYINVLNRGGVPNISTAWEHIVENECQFGFDQAKLLYEQQLKQNFGNDEPKSFEEIFQCLKKIRDDSFEKFHSIAGIREKNNFFEVYRQRLQDLMNEKENLALKLNDDMNSTKNEELIQNLSKEVKENINTGSYTADDINIFLRDFNTFLENYDRQACGTQKANALIHFLQQFHPTMVKQLVQSIKSKYDKSNNVEYERGQFQKKEQQYMEDIKLLEDTVKSREDQLKRLETEKAKLETEKNKISKDLTDLKNENSKLMNKNKDLDDLHNQLKQKDEEIKQLKTVLDQLNAKKKKKGCCG